VWHLKAAETQGNLGAYAGPEKSMYHCSLFYLQEEGQPAQLSQENDYL
jgi:hypothetical protein